MFILNVKSLVVVLAVVLSLISCGNSNDKDNKQTKNQPISKSLTNEGITWVYSLPEGLILAQKGSQPLMVDFYADWCGWCKKLDKDVYSDSEIIQLSKKFVSVKVDADKDRESPQKYGVRGLPTIVFLKSNGQIIEQFVGYRKKEDFKKVMTKIIK